MYVLQYTCTCTGTSIDKNDFFLLLSFAFFFNISNIFSCSFLSCLTSFLFSFFLLFLLLLFAFLFFLPPSSLSSLSFLHKSSCWRHKNESTSIAAFFPLTSFSLNGGNSKIIMESSQLEKERVFLSPGEEKRVQLLEDSRRISINQPLSLDTTPFVQWASCQGIQTQRKEHTASLTWQNAWKQLIRNERRAMQLHVSWHHVHVCWKFLACHYLPKESRGLS